MRIALVVLALVAALAALALVGTRVLERDRRALYASFARDRTTELEAISHAFAEDLIDLDKDLDLATTLIAQAENPEVADRELHAIATIKREYYAMAVRRGDRTIRVIAFDAPPDLVLGDALERALAAADATPGKLRVTRTQDHWLRVFSRRTTNGTVAVLADLAILLPRELRSTPDERLLVTYRGDAAPGSALPMAAYPAVIDAAGAQALGLPATPAVTVTAAMTLDEDAPWQLFAVCSTIALEQQEQTLVRRVLVGGALVLVLLLGAAAYVVLVTRRTVALEERLRVKEQLLRSEKLATAGQLAAGIAHEIGTPLGVARGRVELAMARVEDKKHHEIAIDQIDRVTRLIQQLLDYVRPRAAQVTDVELGAAARTVAELLAPQARGVTITVTGAATIRADADQVQQVLINLVLNALDACDKGGHVELRASERMIEVIDDGAGIPRELHAQVFDPFFTTKKRGQGTGLGLWVVAQLVRAQHGAIELESTVGSGTTVRVRWPA